MPRRVKDTNIWAYAKDNDFVIATKDTDFRRLSNEMGHPPKVIWIRNGDASTALVESLLRDYYDEILDFEQDPARAIVELG